MSCNKLLALCAFAAAAACALPAEATPIDDAIGCSATASSCTLSMTQFAGSGSPGGVSPYGTIKLTDIVGGGVSVAISLDYSTTSPGNDVYFANTGAGLPILWDWSGSLTASEISSIVFAGPGSPNQISTGGTFVVSPKSSGGVGDWEFGIACSGNCGNGGSPPHYNSLTFTIGTGNINDFAENDSDIYNATGNNFASDLCVGIKSNGGCVATGDVLSYDAPAVVPEPITLSLFGAGLAGAAAMRRRKKAQKV
jgi:hypothetical protein